MQLSIKHNFPDVERQMARLQRDIADKAMARTLNATVAQARTQMTRQITSEFTLPRAKVVERLRVDRARYKAGAVLLEAALVATNRKGRYRSLNLINFKPRMGTRGLTIQIRKGAGRKTIKAAFIGNKGRTVFERVSGTKMESRAKYRGVHAERIKPVQTIDVSQMFNTRRINTVVRRVIAERLPIIFKRELAFVLRQAGGR